MHKMQEDEDEEEEEEEVEKDDDVNEFPYRDVINVVEHGIQCYDVTVAGMYTSASFLDVRYKKALAHHTKHTNTQVIIL